MSPRNGKKVFEKTKIILDGFCSLSVLYLYCCVLFLLDLPFVLIEQQTQHKYPCPRRDSNPLTFALDRRATGIGCEPQNRLGDFREEKNYFRHKDSDPGSFILYPNHYTNYAVPVSVNKLKQQ